MTTVLGPRTDLALDPDVVLALLADPVASWAYFRPVTCMATLLKRREQRVVVRYDLARGSDKVAVVGKWYANDRGALVANALETLRRSGFAKGHHGVPSLLGYEPEIRALFTEAVEAPVLREELEHDQSAARWAGRWLAAFHASGLLSERLCGQGKQRRSVARWSKEQPALSAVASKLDEALASMRDSGLPVHYDFYHSQILVTPERTVVVDLDEAGMGTSAFDLAHFEAHLRMLALQRYGDPDRFQPAIACFREGYRIEAGSVPEPDPALISFAWFKLAYQALERGAPEPEWRFAAHEAKLSALAA
jgi:streptomycin 6-kinase